MARKYIHIVGETTLHGSNKLLDTQHVLVDKSEFEADGEDCEIYFPYVHGKYTIAGEIEIEGDTADLLDSVLENVVT